MGKCVEITEMDLILENAQWGEMDNINGAQISQNCGNIDLGPRNAFQTREKGICRPCVVMTEIDLNTLII